MNGTATRYGIPLKSTEVSQSKLRPLPASCPPHWILGSQDRQRQSLIRVQTLFRVARSLVCYQSCFINKCRAQHQLLSQPDPAQGATRHLTQECFLQLVVLVSQERYPTGTWLGRKPSQQHSSRLTCHRGGENTITYAGTETELGREPEMTLPREPLQWIQSSLPFDCAPG